MDANLDRILCAVDFSRFSKSTIDYATGLAHRLGSHITIFHALSSPRTTLQGNSDFRRGTARPEQTRKAYTRIEKWMANRPVPWDTVVRCGDAVDSIVDYTENIDVGLVMAASYGLSAWKRLLMGTVVESLSRTLKRPLLVVRPSRKKSVNSDPTILQLKKILVCSDLSSITLSLFPYAEMLSQNFNAELHIVHALQTPVKEDLIDPSTAPYAEVQDKLQFQLLEKLHRRMPMTFQKNPGVATAIIPGNPSDSLHDYAIEHDIDLILVGVRPRGSIQKIFIGSTTESMIRYAPCNVLTIPCKAVKEETHV